MVNSFTTFLVFEHTSRKWIRAAENWMPALAERSSHLLCGSVALPLRLVGTCSVPLFTVTRAKKSPKTLCKFLGMVHHHCWVVQVNHFMFFSAPRNVVEHAHE